MGTDCDRLIWHLYAGEGWSARKIAKHERVRLSRSQVHPILAGGDVADPVRRHKAA
jgi:hypothetical protein